MNDLVECIFEHLNVSQVNSILRELVHDSANVKESWSLPNDKKFFGESVLNDILICVSDLNFDAIFINLFSLKNCEINIYLPCVRIIKYDSSVIDLEINFTFNSIREAGLSKFLSIFHKSTVRLAKQNRIGNFYCGMEPAEDRDTRFFTGNTRGPLKWR